MQKILTVGMAAILIFAMLGCKGGDISAEQQTEKKNALNKLSKDHPDPNRQERPE